MQLNKSDLLSIVNKKLDFKVIDIPKVGEYLLAYSNNSVDFNKAQKEYFQIFDYMDKSVNVDGLDLIFYRGECHGDNRLKHVKSGINNQLYHRGVNILFIKDDKVFLSERPDKDLYGNMTEFSVSEHINVDESYEDGCVRGVEEELRDENNNSLKINPDEFKLYLSKSINDFLQSEQVKYYSVDFNGKEIRLSDEVKAGNWHDISILQYQLKKNKNLDGLNFRPDHLSGFRSFLANY